MSELNKNQQDLAALIDRIFEDGVVESSERNELKQFWANRGMTVSQVRVVVDAFVARVWDEVIADGVITEYEKKRLQAVVFGLHLPDSALPDLLKKAISD